MEKICILIFEFIVLLMQIDLSELSMLGVSLRQRRIMERNKLATV
jgi:hypothetical protein